MLPEFKKKKKKRCSYKDYLYLMDGFPTFTLTAVLAVGEGLTVHFHKG